jgi:hypothetical protein
MFSKIRDRGWSTTLLLIAAAAIHILAFGIFV